MCVWQFSKDASQMRDYCLAKNARLSRSSPRFFGGKMHPTQDDNHSYRKPRSLAAMSTMAFPMVSEAVAAGEGTFRTCSIFPEGTN
jgi:hypothetical protein